jgi:hypothetical protein
VDPTDDEIKDMMVSEKLKTEPINPKLDFCADVPHVNQVLSYDRV